MQIVDVSVLVNNQTPVYPGNPPVSIAVAGKIENDGYTGHLISMGTHAGTHIDAPMHMLAGGKSLDSFPIEQFVGHGVYCKIDGSFDLETVAHLDITPGDIVIFHTGASDHYHEQSYFKEYPAMSPEIAEYLVSKKVKLVGLDTCSADNTDTFPVHKTLLGSGVLIIENLTNLAPLAGKEFTVYALPLKLDADGAPARVIAVL